MDIVVEVGRVRTLLAGSTSRSVVNFCKVGGVENAVLGENAPAAPAAAARHIKHSFRFTMFLDAKAQDKQTR